MMRGTFGGKGWDQWLEEYSRSHRHPVNRACHSIGIPLIVISMGLAIIGLLLRAALVPAMIMFAAGWVLQFAGHGFERKLPEFFHDWRFLFVGIRWWFATIRGRK
jgi:uncharacterized membrane protein YGL010W